MSNRSIALLKLGVAYAEAVKTAKAEGFMTKEDVEGRASQLCADDPEVNYAKVIRDVCATAFDGRGITYEEVRIGSEISEKIAAAAMTDHNRLTLTDAEYNHFTERLKRFVWRIAHPNVIKFLNDVRDAPPETK